MLRVLISVSYNLCYFFLFYIQIYYIYIRIYFYILYIIYIYIFVKNKSIKNSVLNALFQLIISFSITDMMAVFLGCKEFWYSYILKT